MSSQAEFRDEFVPQSVHLTQKDNFNPDGSHNMDKSIWGRFNQCYVASAVSTMTQNANFLTSEGKIDPQKRWFMDEFAYNNLLNGAILERAKNGEINVKEGFNEEPSKVRFLWLRHADLMSLMFGDYSKKKYHYRFYSYSEKDLINTTKLGLQTLFSVKIREIYGSGDGHIVSSCGLRYNEKGEVIGIFIQDPAGSLFEKNSYRNDLFTGEKVYWSLSQLRRITKTGCHIMKLEERKNG
ncbi:hypothetical protein [Leptospira jelokensis]|uniref:Uncharacterized protein n=1 Tax=Leptospira jelokensis TaxID=2484931 RepID=A0A4Z0ZW90_9LEPT|nr:hypothetical protein [Leptospira jelokensis]TGL58637.1 hypothetical protein EHQ62_17235 [Leptospira jelokensis]